MGGGGGGRGGCALAELGRDRQRRREVERDVPHSLFALHSVQHSAKLGHVASER